MASSAKNPFIFVFTYRPIPNDHPFLKMIEEVEKRNSVAELKLKGLSANNVHALVCDLLSMDRNSEHCGKLSTFLCRITNGKLHSCTA
jgi:hypothetical protein